HLRQRRGRQVLARKIAPVPACFSQDLGLHAVTVQRPAELGAWNFGSEFGASRLKVSPESHGCTGQQGSLKQPGGNDRARGQGPEGGPGPFAISRGARAGGREPG